MQRNGTDAENGAEPRAYARAVVRAELLKAAHRDKMTHQCYLSYQFGSDLARFGTKQHRCGEICRKNCADADEYAVRCAVIRAEGCADPRADVCAENMQMTRNSWLRVKVSKH